MDGLYEGPGEGGIVCTMMFVWRISKNMIANDFCIINSVRMTAFDKKMIADFYGKFVTDRF